MPGKILVLKFFQSIRLKQFLIINVFGKNQVTSQLFFIELIFKQEAGSEEVVFRSSVARSAFQAIRLHDSLIINILGENQLISQIFMHAVSHQGKTASETTTVVGFGQLSFLSNWIADSMINNFFENNHLTSQFFAWSQSSRGRSHWRLLLLVGSGQFCASCQTGFQDFLVINISGMNVYFFLFLFYLFLSIIYKTLHVSIQLSLIS